MDGDRAKARVDKAPKNFRETDLTIWNRSINKRRKKYKKIYINTLLTPTLYLKNDFYNLNLNILI